ncbi:MAG: metallophosphoesterase [Schleiferilactobacillus harbinensis]
MTKQIAPQLIVLSDLHLNGQPERHQTVVRALQTAAEQAPTAHLVVNGDLTDTGTAEQFQEFHDIIAASSFAGRTWATLGNHDVRGSHWPDWDNSEQADPQHFHAVTESFYTQYLQSLPEIDRQALSFVVHLAAYQHIFLNTEKGLKDSAYFSPETLTWLTDQLAQAAATGQPTLIFCHQPLRQTHWRGNFGGGIGLEDQALKQILTAYPNTYFISGHIHNGFGVTGVVERPFGTAIDLPALAVSENGHVGHGLGFITTLGAADQRWAAWDFVDQTPLPQYDFQVAVPTTAALMQTVRQQIAAGHLAARYDTALAALAEKLDQRFDQHLFDDPETDGGMQAPPAPLYTAGEITAMQAGRTQLVTALRNMPLVTVPRHQPVLPNLQPPLSDLAQLALVAKTLWESPNFSVRSHLALQFSLARLNLILAHPTEFTDAARTTATKQVRQAIADLVAAPDKTGLMTGWRQLLERPATPQSKELAAQVQLVLQDPEATTETIQQLQQELASILNH